MIDFIMVVIFIVSTLFIIISWDHKQTPIIIIAVVVAILACAPIVMISYVMVLEVTVM